VHKTGDIQRGYWWYFVFGLNFQFSLRHKDWRLFSNWIWKELKQKYWPTMISRTFLFWTDCRDISCYGMEQILICCIKYEKKFDYISEPILSYINCLVVWWEDYGRNSESKDCIRFLHRSHCKLKYMIEI